MIEKLFINRNMIKVLEFLIIHEKREQNYNEMRLILKIRRRPMDTILDLLFKFNIIEYTKYVITLIGKFAKDLLKYDKIPRLKLSEIVFGDDGKLKLLPATYISKLYPSKDGVISLISRLKSDNNREMQSSY